MSTTCFKLRALFLLRAKEGQASSDIFALERGDRVIQVRELEPTALGSSPLRLANRDFPVFIEGARYPLATKCLSVDENAQVRRK